MKKINIFHSFLVVLILLAAGCGGGGGGGTAATPVLITANMNTVVTNPTAVGTVSLAGVSSPIIYGFRLKISYPSGVTVASVVKSGIAPASSIVTPPNTVSQTETEVSLAGSDGFGAGEVLKVNFATVPGGVLPSAFGVTLLSVFDANGVQIQ